MNNSGFMDIINIFIIGVVLIVTIVFAYKVMTAFNTNIQASDTFDAPSKAIHEEVKQKFEGTMDSFFILTWFAFYIFALISAWFIDTHPLFFFLSIIVLVVILVAIAPMVKVTEEIVSSTELLSTGWSSQFPIMYFVVQNFYAIIVAQAMLLLIVLYAKSRSV